MRKWPAEAQLLMNKILFDKLASHVANTTLRVIERMGRVVFIDPEMENGLGDVALKLRY